MEQKDERTLDLLVTAKWVDEDGNEYEQNMQIADIARQNSVFCWKNRKQKNDSFFGSRQL